MELVGPPTPGSAAQIAFALGIDVHEDLRAVRVPTLVVAADRDRFVAPAHSAEIAEGIAGARLVHLGGGHASLFEEPRLIQEALLGFLEALA
jgi:pimeloyl-ACP methyl ester carboxylesterase